MTFVFSPRQITNLRERTQSGHVSATLALLSEDIKPRRLRYVYREWMAHDEDGNPSGIQRAAVNDVTSGGLLKPARLTVLLVEKIDMYELTRPSDKIGIVTLEAAKACGFGSIQDIRLYWELSHPNSPIAQLIWFMLGDVRDKDRFLQRYISRGGDYTGDWTAAIDDLPALTEAQLRELAASNHQRDLARMVVEHQDVTEDESLAQRVARLESAGDRVQKEIRQELRIITDRTRRGLRRSA